jgi:hypothetical protein
MFYQNPNNRLLYYIGPPKMVEQLVARQREMQQRHATAKFQQTTMTQQFRANDEEEEEQLPKDWQKMRDRPGGSFYYFNTRDHDIQYDPFVVHQLAAKAAAAEQELESPLRDSTVRPDGVVSSSNNNITPSPVLSRNSGSRGDQKMPAKSKQPTTFGGFFTIDDDTTSDDDDEVTVVPPPQKKRRKTSPMRANHRSQSIPQVVFGSIPPAFASMNSDDDQESDENSNDDGTEVAEYQVATQDLPNSDDFGAAKTLADLGLDDSDDE